VFSVLARRETSLPAALISGYRTFGAATSGVVVAGIVEDTVYVDDNGRYPMSVEDFGKAWSRYREGRHDTLVIHTAGPVDLPTAIQSAVATTVAHLTGPMLGNSFDVNFSALKGRAWGLGRVQTGSRSPSTTGCGCAGRIHPPV
jgi:hypothetical protein